MSDTWRISVTVNIEVATDKPVVPRATLALMHFRAEQAAARVLIHGDAGGEQTVTIADGDGMKAESLAPSVAALPGTMRATRRNPPKALPFVSLLALDRDGMAIFERAEDAAFAVAARTDVPTLARAVIDMAADLATIAAHVRNTARSCHVCHDAGDVYLGDDPSGGELRTRCPECAKHAEQKRDVAAIVARWGGT